MTPVGELVVAAACMSTALGLVLGWVAGLGAEDDSRLELDTELRRHLDDLNDANAKLREINNALREARERS